MELTENQTTHLWKGFSTFIYDSYSGPKQECINSDSQQNLAPFSLLLTFGGQEIVQLLHESMSSQDEISLIHSIFSEVEKLCLLKLIIEYEKYKQSLQTTKVNYTEYPVSVNSSNTNTDNCNDNDTACQNSLAKAVILLENKKPQDANDTTTVMSENIKLEKNFVQVKTDKTPNNIQESKPGIFKLAHSSSNSNDLPCLKNISINNVADKDKVETTTIRRSLRQIRVSSKYAENRNAIEKLLKPPVKKVTTSNSEVINSTVQTQRYVCQKIFRNFKSLKNHLKSHEQIENQKKGEHLDFVCKICGSKFEKMHQLKGHFRSHKQKEKCEVQNFSTQTTALSEIEKDINTNSTDLKEKEDSQDLQSLEEEVLLKCSNCGKTYESEQDLQNHIASCEIIPLKKGCGLNHGQIDSDVDKKQHADVSLTQHEQSEVPLEAMTKTKIDDHFECTHCSKVFKTRLNRNLHMSIHTGEKPHICEFCRQSFRLKQSLNRHKRIHDEMFQMRCEFCPKVYVDKKEFENHKLIHTGVKPYSCQFCGKGFRRLIGLKNHQKRHRQEEAFKCTVCNKKFVDKWALVKHKTVHSGEKPFVCMCGKMFRLKKGLQEHAKIHNKELQLKCSLCPRTFVDKRRLDEHQSVHSGEKPFMCHKCGKSFMNSSNLKIHDRCHTGEKPYKCKYCEMTFSQQGSCTAHERHHRGDKPHVCEVCGDGFITKSHLTVHRRRHFNDRPYKCDKCDYAAYTGSLLRVHMVKHSNEKPFTCQSCPAAFKRQHHLDVHNKTHESKIAIKNEVVDIVVFKCPYCSKCFESEKLLTDHIDNHGIVVVTETAANYDGVSNDGEPDEVAYNIVVL